MVRGAGVGLGYRSLLRDLGINVPLRVWTDSSAAMGICSRQVLGKLRHLDTHTLWIQQAVRSRQIDLRKVDGEVNPADLFTKHSLSRERLMALTRLFDVEYKSGRAASAAQTRKTPGTKITMASAGEEAMAIGESEQHPPTMPHKVHTKEVLDKLYPSLQVPPEVDEGDPQANERDRLLEHGLEQAKEIMEAAREHGRRRVQR